MSVRFLHDQKPEPCKETGGEQMRLWVVEFWNGSEWVPQKAAGTRKFGRKNLELAKLEAFNPANFRLRCYLRRESNGKA